MAWSDMEPKQKGMLVAIIILFAIIGYMVYKFFFAGSSPAPVSAAAPAPKAAVVAAQPQQAAATASSPASELATNDNSKAGVAASTVNIGPAAPAAAAPGATAASETNPAAAPGANPATAPGANAAAPGAPSVPQMVQMPNSELTPEELSLLEERRQVQQQYLELVNQYQLMEMQNKLATSQSTLVKAQLETAKAAQQAAKMGIILPGQPGADSDDADKSLSGVTLVYVGQRNNVWSAVLNLRGQYVTVKQGSHLPDNSVVSKIEDNSIVLYKDGERRILMLATAVEQTSDDTDTASTEDGSKGDAADDADASSDDTQ